MRRFLAKISLAALAVLAFALALTGCSSSSSKKEYDYLVTFDYNVGTLSDSTPTVQYLGVAANSLVVLKPGDSNTFSKQTVSGYYIAGWCVAQGTDGEGEPLTGDDGRVLLGDEWDFDSDRVTQNITLYADLQPLPTLTIVGGDENVVFSKEPGETTAKPSSVFTPSKSGYTFVEYYEDEAYTQAFSWPYTYEAGVDKTVYARFIEGDWTIVTTPSELTTAIVLNNNIYLDADLDFSSASWTSGRSYSASFNGNGHTVSNISLNLTGSTSNQTNLALFGTIGEGASIYDVSFENIQVSFTYTTPQPPSYRVALFADTISEGATLSGVSVSGTLTYTPYSQYPYIVVNLYGLCTNEEELGEDFGEDCSFAIELVTVGDGEEDETEE